MSFWNLTENNEDLTKNTDGNFSAGGGDIEPIPGGTQVKACCEEAKWADYDGEEYINLKWRVAAPDDYKNRVLFQKLWVLGNNPNQSDDEKRKKQGDKAKRMLAAIAQNAGGGLLKVEGRPSDLDLQSNLSMKMMALTLEVWDIDGKTGNWVQQVAPVKRANPPASADGVEGADDAGWS